MEEQIAALRNELHKHSYHYYVLNNPLISDKKFDDLMAELQLLEDQNPQFSDPNSPTKRVGNDINLSFNQRVHQYPMLSLSNTYSEGEVQDFYNRVAKTLNEPFELVCELKYDGTSISLTYINGKLVHAVTRGDGEKGDDVTENVKTIRSIPLQLHGDYPALFEIRGEIVMPFAVFDQLNVERLEKEEIPFANPRNAASGALKLQNSAITASRKLDAYFYHLLGFDLLGEQFANLEKAAEWGFKTSKNSCLCSTIEQVFDFLKQWDHERSTLPVATDGVVLKVNSLKQQRNLGNTEKSPRWAIAYKFQAEQATTKLNSVDFQVGRTGAVTPVANLDAVHLSGTTVKRASLHNADIIEALDLHIGDLVYVEKGGEIIPKITGVDQTARHNSGQKVAFITHCPECNTELIRVEGEAAIYCPNENGCPPQIKGKIAHFISRKAMNIDGIGLETIDLLYRQRLIESVADLYELKTEQIVPLERLGDKSAQKMILGIEESKQIPFERVLYALGIRMVGETVAKKITKSIPSMPELMNATMDQLIEIDEVGERIAQSILDYFKDERNVDLIHRLTKSGLQMESIPSNVLIADHLKGASFVISGLFEQHSRDEYKSMIEGHGGKNTTSISAKTTYLLAGTNMGPSKLEKAQKLGIKMVNEQEFLAMINK